MSNMFNNYTDTYNAGKCGPDNKKKELDIEQEYWDELVIGAPNYYVYIVDFPDHSTKATDIKNVIITVAQGTENILDNIPYEIKEYNIGLIKTHYYCKIIWKISEKDSLLFNSFNRNTFAQLKLIFNTGDIIYSPKLKLDLKANLNKEISND